MNINPQKIIIKYFPEQGFSLVEHSIKTQTAKAITVNMQAVEDSFVLLADSFKKNNKQAVFNKKALSMASKLDGGKDDYVTGFILNFLAKLNKDNNETFETVNKMRLARAQKDKQPTKVLARAFELNEIYRQTDKYGKKRLQTLLIMKRSLKRILSFYNDYRVLNVPKYKLQSRENYEFMLSSVRIELSKLYMEKHPDRALRELRCAKLTMSKYGTGTISDKIKKLEKTAKEKLKNQNL